MTVVKLKGFEGLDKSLRGMKRAVRADVLEDVAEESADPFVVDYAYDAPHWMRRGVRVRTVDKMPNRVTTAVGSRHPLAHIFEFGTRRRRTSKGYARGKIQKIGFARRAFDVNVSGWFRNVGKLLWREVSRGSR